ncbi:MAG: aminotransferase class V-fold PLP-dependent enzyme, partial [Chloroflexi bacterium]|nr:aminotransferase class V-fold PLP-dependent enzyme [Chloroflexota bacterium]
MNDADVEAIRAGFPALNREIYLNAGTYGPLPTVVADTLRDWYTMLEQEGPWAPPAVKRSHEECETTRRKVADLLGADPEEIALTRSTSEGTDIIGYGIRWREGDEVIVSDQEHEGCWIVWQSLSRRYGIRVRVLPLTEDQDELLSRLEAMMTPRTRLVFLSHVSCQSGLRILPAPIGRLVHEHGAFFMLDGAHAVGQFPVDVRALNCDFYTGCGHKWL